MSTCMSSDSVNVCRNCKPQAAPLRIPYLLMSPCMSGVSVNVCKNCKPQAAPLRIPSLCFHVNAGVLF